MEWKCFIMVQGSKWTPTMLNGALLLRQERIWRSLCDSRSARRFSLPRKAASSSSSIYRHANFSIRGKLLRSSCAKMTLDTWPSLSSKTGKTSSFSDTCGRSSMSKPLTTNPFSRSQKQRPRMKVTMEVMTYVRAVGYPCSKRRWLSKSGSKYNWLETVWVPGLASDQPYNWNYSCFAQA